MSNNYEPTLPMDVFERYLTEALQIYAPASPTLRNAMEYSLSTGGKRFRPMLLLATALFGKGNVEDTFPAAAALEWIHTYSLIHDDLPAMDDDDFRRGKPTTHKQFNEAVAILAGDALLTAAFTMILNQESISYEKRVLLAKALGEAAGPNGMVAGQMNDIEGEEKELSLEQLAAIHQKKTGELIEYALYAGCLLADVPVNATTSLRSYGKHLGLAYQIHNDLKDVLLDTDDSGKEAGRDQVLGKNTYPSLLGVSGAVERLETEIQAAENELEKIRLGADSAVVNVEYLDVLYQLLEYVKIDSGV